MRFINAWVGQNCFQISPEMMEDNSSMRLKHKIDEIQNEKFSAAENVKKSAVLQKTIRKVGTQMVNHDIECKSESLSLSHYYVNDKLRHF